MQCRVQCDVGDMSLTSFITYDGCEDMDDVRDKIYTLFAGYLESYKAHHLRVYEDEIDGLFLNEIYPAFIIDDEFKEEVRFLYADVNPQVVKNSLLFILFLLIILRNSNGKESE